MKRLLLGSLGVGAVLALTRRLFARTVSARPASNHASYAAIDAYIEQAMRRLHLPGVSLAIVQGDKIAHMRGFGKARPGGEAPTPKTPFLIGSLTKSITALAVMQLVEAGRIELDAPVQRYLPWFRVADPQASANMKVRHLLNQTSGLPESAGETELADAGDDPDAAERQARALAALELTRPVGAACEYSNMNYNLLGLVIEAASGQAYADYVREHIFTPLEMQRSYTSPSVARQHGLAMGHRYWFGIPIAAPDLPIPQASLASGQLISSAEDMARYLIAHLNAGRYGQVQVLSSAGMHELHRGVAEYGKMGVSAGKYGMGWFDSQIGHSRVVWHSGTNPDFGSYMALLPEQGLAVVLLFNACHYWFNPVLTELGAGVAALLAGEQYSPTAFSALIPWMLPGQLLIPVLQIVDVVATRRLLRRWRLQPELRASAAGQWRRHVLLPLLPHVSLVSTLKPMRGSRGGFFKLFMPDTYWIAVLCGGFALVWSLLRTGLVVGALLGSSSPPSVFGRLRSER